ncbi:MAG: TrkH family potassium uptake protein [Phycisphaeraceae bacterium]
MVELEPNVETPGVRKAWIDIHRVHLMVMLWRLALTGITAAGIVLEHGFYELPTVFGGQLRAWQIHLVQMTLLAVYALDVILRYTRRRVPMPGAGLSWMDRALFVMAAFGAVLGTIEPHTYGWQVFEIAAAALFFSELWRTNVALSRVLTRPGMLLPLSFATLIGIGTLLIKTPVATPEGHPGVSWLDALFTMTSAVCVTGLTVRTTATDFSPFGQMLIGIFIQLGGLGILIFGSVFAMLLGRSLSLREHLNLSEMLESQPLRNITGFVRFIVLTTLGIELIGAIAMMFLWGPEAEGWTWEQYLGMSLFHSVSAFCNAGFDLTGNSLEPYRMTLLAHAVVLPMVVIGGIGFPVLENLRWVIWGKVQRWLGRPLETGVNRVRYRLSLHTKVTLMTTAALYLFGVVFIFAGHAMPYFYDTLEQGQTANVERPGEFGWEEAGRFLAEASFMSLATRTAGFNTVPTEEMSTASHFTMMLLMVIGGGPGSTAGGTKVTVLALLVLSVVATMRNRQETEAFGRTIADAVVRRAATIGICFMLLIGTTTLLLSYSEPYRFERIFFEAISAAGTVGLSLGITDGLTSFGKGVIIVTMYLGRVGPLTLLAALIFTQRLRRPYAYAHENVVLG